MKAASLTSSVIWKFVVRIRFFARLKYPGEMLLMSLRLTDRCMMGTIRWCTMHENANATETKNMTFMQETNEFGEPIQVNRSMSWSWRDSCRYLGAWFRFDRNRVSLGSQENRPIERRISRFENSKKVVEGKLTYHIKGKLTATRMFWPQNSARISRMPSFFSQ